MNTSNIPAKSQSPVKRTFWLGMLGVLLCIPDILRHILLFMFVLADVHSKAGYNLMFKEDARLYDLLNSIIGYEYINVVLVLIAALLYIPAILLAWYIMKQKPAVKPWFRWGWKQYITAAMLFMVFLLVGYLPIALNFFVLVDPLFNAPFLFSFPNPVDATLIYAVYMLPLIPYFFVVFSLMGVAIDGAVFEGIKEKAIVPVLGALVFGGCLITVVAFQDYIDLDNKLADISGVAFEAEPRTLVCLSGLAEQMHLEDKFSDDLFPGEKVPYNVHNEDVIREYMDSKDYWTTIVSSGYDYVIQRRMREFDVDGAIVASMEKFLHTGDGAAGMFLLFRLRNAHASESYLNIADRLSDETAFVLKGKPALELSRIYVKYNERDKANYWYDNYARWFSDETEKYPVPDRMPFNRGSITGSFIFDGEGNGSATLGVVRKKHYEYLENIAENNADAIGTFNLICVLDGTATGPDGRFEFTGLGEDEYVLLLSLEDVPGRRYRVVKSPGVISISEQNPSVDVGTIELILEDEGASTR